MDHSVSSKEGYLEHSMETTNAQPSVMGFISVLLQRAHLGQSTKNSPALSSHTPPSWAPLTRMYYISKPS